MPHRPACGRRRPAGPQTADRAWTRNRRPDRGGRRRRRPQGRLARRRRLAQPRLRPLPLLQKRARKPVRFSAVHRLHTRRGLCDPCDRRGRFRVSARRGPRSGSDRSAALRRADRLALAEGRGRGRGDRDLRFRRGRPHHSAGLPMAGAARFRLHAAGRHRGAAISPARSAPTGPADRTRRRRPRSTPPSCSRRSGRSCPRRSRRCARADGSSAAASI